MRMSAKMLGAPFGLSAQEMNHALKKSGFLDGVPGDYEVTEKGAKYALERDYHRGNGGYACYNAYWTTRSWDDSIINQLDLSDDYIASIKQEVSELRRLKREQAAEWVQEVQPEGQTNRVPASDSLKGELFNAALSCLPELLSWVSKAWRKHAPMLFARSGE